MDGVTAIVCVECGGTAHRQSYPPPDEPLEAGDVVTFACEDCHHRLDLVIEADDEGRE